MKIGIVASQYEEIERLVEPVEHKQVVEACGRVFYEYQYDGLDVVAVFSHWGKVGAAVTVSILLERFKPDILEVRYRGCNVDDILNMSVSEAIDFFSSDDNPSAQRITARLKTLVDVGLSYIKLGQSSSTLSGGESQRIKLAYYLSMTQNRDSVRPERILFIFDEPTTGLHFYDVEKLLRSFDVLLSKGHSIVVVEHNPDVIRAADWVLDLGPDAGDNGGELVFAGTPEELVAQGNTFTAKYL